MGQTVLGREGTPNDVTAAVRLLASEDAAYLTGQILQPNGWIGLREVTAGGTFPE